MGTLILYCIKMAKKGERVVPENILKK